MRTSEQLTSEVDRNAAGAEAAENALRDLARLAGGSATTDAITREAARLTADHFGAPFASLAVRVSAQDAEHSFARTDEPEWPQRLRDMVLEVQAEPRAIGRIYQVGGKRIAAIAAPLPGEFTGAIATMALAESTSELESLLQELRAIASTISAALNAQSNAARPSTLPSDRAAATIAKASAYSSLHEFAFALTNNLRNKLGAESVCLAVPTSGRYRVISISGLDDVKPRSPGTIAMRQAIEEAADQGRVLCAQADDQWNDNKISTGHPLHRAWSVAAAGASVLTIPLFADHEITAVVAMTRRGDRPFSPEDLASAQNLLEPFGPAIPMVRRATRPLHTHASDLVRKGIDAALRPEGWGAKAIAAAATLVTAWFLFGTVQYNVNARAIVKPVESIQLSAPFDAAVASVAVSAGDRVIAGQTLATLDTRDLELERSQLDAEIRALVVEIDQALASSDAPSAALAAARRDALAARLGTIDSRIDAAIIRAPGDGMILEGSPGERIGQRLPTGEPIFVFVPRDALRIDVHSPEHAADDIKQALAGRFAPEARPESRIAFTIDRVEPATRVEDGQNIVAARAQIDATQNPEWLRPGMRGTAQVQAGHRPVWWVAFHRITDAFHARFMP